MSVSHNCAHRFAIDVEPSSKVMDAALVAAVRSFQEENDLLVTGTITPQTVRVLNEKAQPGQNEKINIPSIISNMERWRWLPRELGDHHVIVNIPEYLVRLKTAVCSLMKWRVVVGKPKSPTPIFSDEMEYVVVNPSWTVPPSIVKKRI